MDGLHCLLQQLHPELHVLEAKLLWEECLKLATSLSSEQPETYRLVLARARFQVQRRSGSSSPTILPTNALDWVPYPDAATILPPLTHGIQQYNVNEFRSDVIEAKFREANEEIHIIKRMKLAGNLRHEYLLLGAGLDPNGFWIRMERGASRDPPTLTRTLKLVSYVIPANDTVSVRANCDLCGLPMEYGFRFRRRRLKRN